MSLLFNILSRLIIAFLPSSKCLLISWLQSPSVVILEPPKIKALTVSIVSPSICHQVMGPDAMILVFWMLSFKPTFSLSSKGSLVLCFLPWGWCHLPIWGYWYFFWLSWLQLGLHEACHFWWLCKPVREKYRKYFRKFSSTYIPLMIYLNTSSDNLSQ